MQTESGEYFNILSITKSGHSGCTELPVAECFPTPDVACDQPTTMVCLGGRAFTIKHRMCPQHMALKITTCYSISLVV